MEKIIEENRKKLEEERTSIANELSEIDKEEKSNDESDLIGEPEMETRVEDLLTKAQSEIKRENLVKYLHEVKQALNRIKKGTYGKCINCGKPIPLNRLKAFPAAKYCINCASVKDVTST